MRNPTIRPADVRIAELRTNLHELYKRRQTTLLSPAELGRVNEKIVEISTKIARIQANEKEADAS